ncbi:uncharacterized protein LODBEIA_P07420 [Lodderomyces beijingensis]|uniref:MICOS complex subunit n=1 Tax=Lodderomyces beijingensis TaxID=1775926 RepID=A0ABP0ZEE0_9ASCO
MAPRSFYENDTPVIPKPGTTQPISRQLEEEDSPHGQVSFVNGMIIRTTPQIETWMQAMRTSFNRNFQIWEAELATQKSAFSNELTHLQNDFDAVVTEPILPRGLYILTVALTGSIMARNSNIVVRFMAPVAFGAGALRYFMPQTFHNVGARYDAWEKANAPHVYAKRMYFIKDMKDVMTGFDDEVVKFNDSVILTVHDWRSAFKQYWDEDQNVEDKNK